MKPWIALVAIVTTIGLYGCSQSPTAAALGTEPTDGVHKAASDSVSGTPAVEQEELAEVAAEAATGDELVGDPVTGVPVVEPDPPPAARRATAGRRVGTAVATAGEAVAEEAVTDESLATEAAAMTAEAAAAAVESINEGNYLRVLADLERQIGTADGA